MPCTYSRNPQYALPRHRSHKLRGSHPIGAQLNGIAVVGYAESGMCDSSTDVTIILYDQEVRHGIVRQALLSGYEQVPRCGRKIRDRQQL